MKCDPGTVISFWFGNVRASCKTCVRLSAHTRRISFLMTHCWRKSLIWLNGQLHILADLISAFCHFHKTLFALFYKAISVILSLSVFLLTRQPDLVVKMIM